MDKVRRIGRGVFLATAFACMAISFAGCTRAFYRKQADKEVTDILMEKDKIENAKIEQWHVYTDPRARHADPTNPDRPPMPPDDEDAWRLGPHPQKPGHRGTATVEGTAYLEMIKVWDSENRAERQAQSAVTGTYPIKAYLDEPMSAPEGGFLLKMDQAIELGVINSPPYQSFREALYLAALPVTQARYGFAYQWAATADWIRQWAGPQAPFGPGGPGNNWTGSSTLGFSKLFATGALLTADFTNTTVFNFVGNGMTSQSTINASLTQPFLQGGGKAVTLEPLAQAERNLVYSIRAYARFREQFNVSIALGSSLPTDLRSAAGTASASPISVLAALGIASTDVSGGFVGYLSTLYRLCDLATDQKLAFDLGETLKFYEAAQEGGYYSPLQVDQVRSQMLSAQNTVLQDKQFVSNGLDQFKVLLGLPTNMPLILDDTPAQPITNQLDTYYAFIDDSRNANRRLEKKEKAELVSAKEMRAFLLQTFTNGQENPLVRGTEFQKKFPASWKVWINTKGKDFQDRVEKFSKEKRDLFDLKTDQVMKGKDFSAENERRLREATFEFDLAMLEKELRSYDAEPWAKLPEDQARKKQIDLARPVVARAKEMLVYPRNERFDEVITLWPVQQPVMLDDFDLLTGDVDKAQELAVQSALRNRMDLMNARGQCVDAWRQLKVTANALLGVATAQYTLAAETPPLGQRPLVFTPERTNQQLSLNFQLPLNRLAQRNAYRTAQLNYQLARRSLMTLEDNIAAQVRFDVRQLQLFNANYKIQKNLVHSLYKQVENALDLIVAPTDPDALKGSGTQAAANAAALTNQYLGALGQLNNSQVKMYDIWLSLYATRMQLYLDLERLPMDFRGVWTEIPGATMLPAATPTALPPIGHNRDAQRRQGQVQTAPVHPADDGPSRPAFFLTPRVVP
jgi:hypothetical protein